MRWQLEEISSEDLNDLWVRYKEKNLRKDRDRLIVHYLPLVEYVAKKLGSGLPNTIDAEDLVSYGSFGLIDAIEKFDPGRGYKFETYAMSRIRGSVIDELRLLDWVPRSVRGKSRLVEGAVSKLEGDLKRSPTDEEVGYELGLSGEEVTTILSVGSRVSFVALDELLENDGEGGASVRDLLPDRQVDVESIVEFDELGAMVAGSIGVMSDRERTVLGLYYFEGLTLSDIGLVLGVTESRVCQIHTKAIGELGSGLRDPS